MTARRLAAALGFAAALASVSCRDAVAPQRTDAAPAPAYTPAGPLPGAVQIAWALPRATGPAPDFFDHPWPTELRRTPEGDLSFEGYPGEDGVLIPDYIAAAKEQRASVSLGTAVYFRLTGAPSSRVAAFRAEASLSPSSPVMLVDVDAASPDRGRLTPIEVRHVPVARRFVPAGLLAVKPYLGFLLRPRTLYAAVVRRSLGDASGAALGTTADLEAIKWTARRGDPVEERARLLHAGAFGVLARLGVPREDIAAIALFRTGDPHETFEQMFAQVTGALVAGDPSRPAREAVVPADGARVLAARWTNNHPSYAIATGEYCTPNFQDRIEEAPFLEEGTGGAIARGPDGRPRPVPLPATSPYFDPACAGMLRARFVLSVPRRPMPPGGWPLLLSSHGTTGDALSFVGENDFAGWAAREGIAVVSTDQPLHGGRGSGPRPGSREPLRLRLAGIPIPIPKGAASAEMAFYNPLNPWALVGNLRQAAIDGVVLSRLIARTDFARGPNGPLLDANGDIVAPRFDQARLLLAGHSQGSQSIAAHGAVDPLVRGVLLSGCGGDARLGILLRSDIPGVPFVTALLGLEDGELDAFHPFMTLVQTLGDPVDPQTWARHYWDPPRGARPKNALHYEGVTDTYTPPETAESLATALRAAQLGPALRPVRGLAMFGVPWSGTELHGNVAGGMATIGFVQLASTRGENGHFVIYHEPGAAELASAFFRSALEGIGPVRMRSPLRGEPVPAPVPAPAPDSHAHRLDAVVPDSDRARARARARARVGAERLLPRLSA